MRANHLKNWLHRLVALIRPSDHANPRYSFQLRFFLGACLLGLTVAVLKLPILIMTGRQPATWTVVAFGGLLLCQLISARFGMSPYVLFWSLLATVTLFLIAISLVTRELQPAQLPWFILIPLAARAFTAPRAEDAAPQPTMLTTLVGSGVAFSSIVLIVVLNHCGVTFGQEVPINPVWTPVADFLLLLMSVIGLIVLYDTSAQLTAAELQRVRSLLSICAWCRKIKADKDWITLERYTEIETEVLSHMEFVHHAPNAS